MTKLEEIEGNQIGRACSTDGRLPKEYYEIEWLINHVKKLEGYLSEISCSLDGCQARELAKMALEER